MFSQDRVNFIIYLFISEKEKLNGGLMALHKLAYEIADRGYKVVIFTEPMFKHENISVINSTYNVIDGHHIFHWEGFTYPYENTITIYPEIIKGNPINTKHVVRWLLYEPQTEVENTFLETDYIFNYSSHFSKNLKSISELTTLVTNSDIFYNFNSTQRKGYCYISGKKEPKDYKKVITDYNADVLNGWQLNGGLEYLNKKFNKYKYFLTYDDKTYFTILASLSGLIPIIIPQDNRLPIEFRQENPIQNCGVAYGFEDIEWAIKTNHLVRDNINQYEKYFTKTINNFISYIEKKIYE
jgi:hypothetical protein